MVIFFAKRFWKSDAPSTRNNLPHPSAARRLRHRIRPRSCVSLRRCSLFEAVGLFVPSPLQETIRFQNARFHQLQTKTGFRTVRGETCFDLSGRYWARTNDLHDVNVSVRTCEYIGIVLGLRGMSMIYAA